MKLCPTCGEVYPQGTTKCRAHGTELRDWSEVTQTSGSHTNVEPTDVEPRGKRNTTGTPTFRTVDYDENKTNPGIRARILDDRYLLGRQIGIGGYGAVFAAVDEHTGDRVAIKLLSPALSNDHEAVTRFRREAIAASSVEHEGIVDVTDFHIEAGSTSYIVMEYLDGEDLSETLEDEGKLEPSRALSIAAQCAAALAAAHERHILHRDLKPANIFLTTGERRRDLVKIIDFGISKITQGGGRYTDLTSASKVVGTPFYMSPEQAQGLELDGRTDVYSLGVILYRMITGKRPFTGDSALDILTKHIEAKRVPPSKVEPSLRRFPKLDSLVLQAIAAKTRSRFASMREFREAILVCLQTIDVGAATRLDETQVVSTLLEPTSGQITRQVPARSGRLLRWGAVAVTAAAAAAITWSWTRPSSPTQQQQPTEPTTAPAVTKTSTTPSPIPLAKRRSTVPKAAPRSKAKPRTKPSPLPVVKKQPQRVKRKRRRKRRRKTHGDLGIKDW